MTGTLLLALVGAILFRGAMTGADPYQAFMRGAERGMQSAISLLPAMCAMMLFLRLVTASGVVEIVTRLLLPLTGAANVPQEVTPLLILRPLTGSGSIAALQEIFATSGPDSRAGRLASALMGSSETIFYTLTVYAGAAGVKRVPGAAGASLCGYAASVLVCLLLTQ